MATQYNPLLQQANPVQRFAARRYGMQSQAPRSSDVQAGGGPPQMQGQPGQEYNPSSAPAPIRYGSEPSSFTGAGYQIPGTPNLPNVVTGAGDQSDPYEMYKQNRSLAYNRGNAIDQDLSNTIQNRGNLETGYRNRSDSAYDKLQGNPGFTNEEQQNILQQNGRDTPLTQDQINGFQFTGDEQNSISGDPNKARANFDPARNQAMMNEQTDNAHGAINGMERGVNGALGNQATNTRNAVDTSGVGNTQPYRDEQSAELNQGGNATRSAVNNQNLGVSDQYTRDHAFTDQDAQNMKTAAMTGVGQATMSQQDQVSRAAAASGYNSPMALAAGLNRLQREGGAQEQDAALQAQVAAKNLQLQTAQGTENTRLGATQTQAGMQSGAEQGLMNSALGATGEAEANRQGAAKFTSGQRLSNEQLLGQDAQSNAVRLGQTQLGTEMNLGTQRQDVQNNAANTGIAVDQSIDNAQSQRAGELAGNRQSTAMQGQQSQFGQGNTANTNQSNRYGAIAGQRVQGESDYRNGVTGQANTQASLGTAAQGQRNQNFGTQTGGMNQAAGQYGQYDLGRRGNSFSGAFKRAAGNAIGSSLGFGGSGKTGGTSWNLGAP